MDLLKAMNIEKLQPGMIVYDVSRGKMGNTTISTVRVHPVRIISVDAECRTVVASWNYNPEKKCYSREYEKWRANKPVTITSKFGQTRIATREEKNAIQAATQPTP